MAGDGGLLDVQSHASMGHLFVACVSRPPPHPPPTLRPSQWLFLLGCFISEPLEGRTQVVSLKKTHLGQRMESHIPF